MRALLVSLSLLASTALAQIPPIDIEHLRLDPSARGTMVTGNGQTLGSFQFRAGATLLYSKDHATRSFLPRSELVRDRFAMHVFGAFGITDWLELSVDLPVVLHQVVRSNQPVSTAGVGSPYLGLKVNVLDANRPVTLSAGLKVGLPIGSTATLASGPIVFQPHVNVGRLFDSFQLAGELGALIHETENLDQLTGTSLDRIAAQGYLSAGIASLGDGIRGEASVRTYVAMPTFDRTSGSGMTPAKVGIEALFGFRYPGSEGLDVFVLAGPGYGLTETPAFRLYAGVAFGNGGPLKRPCVEGSEYEVADCPDLDLDGDGVKNADDAAPNDAEDMDGYEDKDGRPEPDNDLDGSFDADDKCPVKAGPKPNKGCPDDDSDKDGVVDRLDGDPKAAEDKDGFEDDDGVPDFDNDKDGIRDDEDKCPNVAGVLAEKGCPLKDEDKDGVADALDNCPKIAGATDNSGCPAAEKQRVVITRDRMEILDKVQFASGKSTILPASFGLLDQVEKILVEKTFILRVRIEGHTDNQGNAKKNLTLSQDRAAAVKTYLVKKGVSVTRLAAMGYGDTVPIADNKTPKGREENRRVVFKILQVE